MNVYTSWTNNNKHTCKRMQWWALFLDISINGCLDAFCSLSHKNRLLTGIGISFNFIRAHALVKCSEKFGRHGLHTKTNGYLNCGRAKKITFEKTIIAFKSQEVTKPLSKVGNCEWVKTQNRVVFHELLVGPCNFMYEVKCIQQVQKNIKNVV